MRARKDPVRGVEGGKDTWEIWYRAVNYVLAGKGCVKLLGAGKK